MCSSLSLSVFLLLYFYLLPISWKLQSCHYPTSKESTEFNSVALLHPLCIFSSWFKTALPATVLMPILEVVRGKWRLRERLSPPPLREFGSCCTVSSTCTTSVIFSHMATPVCKGEFRNAAFCWVASGSARCKVVLLMKREQQIQGRASIGRNTSLLSLLFRFV